MSSEPVPASVVANADKKDRLQRDWPECVEPRPGFDVGSRQARVGPEYYIRSGSPDLHPQVVKSGSASVKSSEFDLRSSRPNSEACSQPLRPTTDETLFANVRKLIDALQTPVRTKHYKRADKQHKELGLHVEPAPTETQQANEAPFNDELAKEVRGVHGNCSQCNVPTDMRMHIVELPHLKGVVIKKIRIQRVWMKPIIPVNVNSTWMPCRMQGGDTTIQITETLGAEPFNHDVS
ncbi:hypothetical protein BC830DRAFT_1166763 [Chytriomyces sp. MP71]|nr:hypothetical protein BC830DRAFT_1166763 [Chytriomyces sp. MP71]